MATVVVNATGFSGNFLPFFLLAKELRKKGHIVKFATGSHYYRDRIEAADLQFIPLI